MNKHFHYDCIVSRKGFTLIELLVVITIISILMAVLIPNLTGGREQAMEAKAKMLVTELEMLCGMYKLDYGTFPPSETEPPWRSSYLAYYLGTKSRSNRPYKEFKPAELTKHPIESETSSEIKNPASPAKTFKYRNNVMDDFEDIDPESLNPPMKKVHGVDIWGDKGKDPTGIHNW